MNETSVLALLDLPVGSVLNLDGETVVLKRDDFVGFYSLLPAVLHLVTVRTGKEATTTGFLFMENLVRRYDPATEEVSNRPIDDPATVENVCFHLQQGKIDPQRAVSYNRFLSQAKKDRWSDLTDFISARSLRLRGLQLGDKLIPGSYAETEEETYPTIQIDGITVSYPPIPVPVDTVVRHTSHEGTKQFLMRLSPSERTAFFTATDPAQTALQTVLRLYYDNDHTDLLGDLQLSFALFLNLHCFSSLIRWRDLVALLCYSSCSITPRQGEYAEQLCSDFIKVLMAQVDRMEDDLLDELDDTFLVPALQHFVSKSTQSIGRLAELLQTKFPAHFDGTLDATDRMVDDDDDDDNSPVVVSMEEVEASVARSKLELSRRLDVQQDDDTKRLLRERYPLLLAAMRDNEDVVMTCARSLDEAVDVSLVRESAAYLEEVEATKQ